MINYRQDVFRYYGNHKESVKQAFNRPDGLKYIRIFRKCNSSNNKFLKFFYKHKLKSISRKTFIQIPHNTTIGHGFYIGHNGRIIINKKAIIGDNCNIGTGVVIGQENRGKRKGCPKIGNKVWIGTNSVIVGNITIGDDVLVAPLTYINRDIPSHCIVIGNPAKVISKQNATKGYINNTI